MNIDAFYMEKGWVIVDVLNIPDRQAQYFPYDSLNINRQTKKFLEKAFPKGIYRHQREAINAFLEKENVCLTTGTASGKSMVFYAASIEEITNNPNSKILAIYPLKALGKEQEIRWQQAFELAELEARVGRIDGQVSVNLRMDIIKNTQVLIITPDVLHAWLMTNLGNKHVIQFVSNLSLIIIDEIHNYTGVFGSNAAFLFRRLQHILKVIGGQCRYICASATISDPHQHLSKLIGVDFRIIDESFNTSPREAQTIRLVNPPQTKDMLTNISELLTAVAQEEECKFIAFVDSRKQTEYVTSIVSRTQQKEAEEDYLNYDHLQKFNILPFRAGYEESDRAIIQSRLSEGQLSGVVSTSALELGIDIPHLNLGILVGVPRSATSFFQRIGRIGRNKRGDIVVVNRGDIYDENIFRNPQRLLNLPLSEGALYLDNDRVQYIHALCLARQGGEHHQVCEHFNISDDEGFESGVNWPKGFVQMCRNERLGLVPRELQCIKEQAGDDPNHVYPLRDVDIQFKVIYKRGPEIRSLGSVSYGQLMREAYPGAVYYYTSRPYRIFRVRVQQREVEARGEKKYTTTPINLPTLIFPNLSQGNIYSSYKCGELIFIECNLQVREAIIGYKERRGPNEITVNYPLDKTTNVFFDQPRFARNFFTSGVIFAHPILNGPDIRIGSLSKLLYEAFLMIIPFERTDINYASDKFKISRNFIKEGEKFICIYDQTYGSLRLSGKILEQEILINTFQRVQEIAAHDIYKEMNRDTLDAIEVLFNDLKKERQDIMIGEFHDKIPEDDQWIKVLLPGSRGLNIDRDNEEFEVEAVFFSPKINGLAYRGKHVSEQNLRHKGIQIIVPLTSIIGVPGESSYGFYNLQTGEIKTTER